MPNIVSIKLGFDLQITIQSQCPQPLVLSSPALSLSLFSVPSCSLLKFPHFSSIWQLLSVPEPRQIPRVSLRFQLDGFAACHAEVEYISNCKTKVCSGLDGSVTSLFFPIFDRSTFIVGMLSQEKEVSPKLARNSDFAR